MAERNSPSLLKYWSISREGSFDLHTHERLSRGASGAAFRATIDYYIPIDRRTKAMATREVNLAARGCGAIGIKFEDSRAPGIAASIS